ncbi:MAG: 3-dehydroquinate synthase [Thermoguttaceae bacterium]|nr:3-dehydroquinate synthase [Thermoguttaceae bacterium]
MSTTRTVSVTLGERSYTIEISSLERLGKIVSAFGSTNRALIVTDENVDRYHADRAAESLAEYFDEIEILMITPGEPAKSLLTSEKLWERFAEMRVDRRTIVIAVGGGVVGDLAGFIAATYMRGLAFIQVPTSLLAQVDSSVGGKVGINLENGKNLVGAFWQPKAVLIDPTVLSTLPEREYLSGLGEVVKYGVILDAAFFAMLEANVSKLLERDPEILSEVIQRCCRLKADVVEQDEWERLGVRAILNYGHTFGHVLESITHYRTYLHGEAVSIGMDFAARLARRMKWIDDAVVLRQRELLTRLKLPVHAPKYDIDDVFEIMRRDKKNEHGQICFVLPQYIGHVERTDVELSMIRDTFEEAYRAD